MHSAVLAGFLAVLMMLPGAAAAAELSRQELLEEFQIARAQLNTTALARDERELEQWLLEDAPIGPRADGDQAFLEEHWNPSEPQSEFWRLLGEASQWLEEPQWLDGRWRACAYHYRQAFPPGLGYQPFSVSVAVTPGKAPKVQVWPGGLPGGAHPVPVGTRVYATCVDRVEAEWRLSAFLAPMSAFSPGKAGR